MKLRKWNYDKHVYEEHEVTDGWDCKWIINSKEVCNCCKCGKEVTLATSFSSLEVHNKVGFGYLVCEKCYQEEIERKYNEFEDGKINKI